MNADEVIESYVRDVASCLPRAKRNDVAYELRALLGDELAAKAEAEGRAPDKAMAMALLKGFGRPAEAARRYHERPALIDPADTHHFIIWTIGGAVALGVLSALSPTDEAVGDHFLQWLGILLIFFALGGWLRRRNPGALGWKPNRGPDGMPRGLAVLSLVATVVFPVFMYAAPETFMHTMFLGAFPTDGVRLTEAFRDSPQRIATLVLLLLTVVIYAGLVIQGEYRAWTRWLGIVTSAGLGGLALMHAAPMISADGGTFQVFESARTNGIAAPMFTGVGAIFLLALLYQLYWEWARIRPAPALKKPRAS